MASVSSLPMPSTQDGFLSPSSSSSSSSLPLYFLALSAQYIHERRPSAVVCSENHIFIGGLGVASSIWVWRFQPPPFSSFSSSISSTGGGEISFVGIFQYMCGGVTSLKLSHDSARLAVCTESGYVYVWDVSHSALENLKASSSSTSPIPYVSPASGKIKMPKLPFSFGALSSHDSVKNEGGGGDGGGVLGSTIFSSYVFSSISDNERVKPLLEIVPLMMGETTNVDFMQDGRTLIGVGKLPLIGISLYNGETGRRMATIAPLTVDIPDPSTSSSSSSSSNSRSRSSTTSTRLKMFEFNCVAVDKQRPIASSSSSTTGGGGGPGRWVGVGDCCGNVGAFLISDSLLHRIISKHNSCLKSLQGAAAATDKGDGVGQDVNNNSTTSPQVIRLRSKDVPFISQGVCERTVAIHDICWRPRSSHKSQYLHLISACTDGFVRFCSFDPNAAVSSTPNTTTPPLIKTHLSKFVRGASQGEVRSICVALGEKKQPVLLAACNVTKMSELQTSWNFAVRTSNARRRNAEEGGGEEETISLREVGGDRGGEDGEEIENVFQIKMQEEKEGGGGGGEVVQLLASHSDYISHVAVSPKSNTFAVSVSYDRTLKIFLRRTPLLLSSSNKNNNNNTTSGNSSNSISNDIDNNNICRTSTTTTTDDSANEDDMIVGKSLSIATEEVKRKRWEKWMAMAKGGGGGEMGGEKEEEKRRNERNDGEDDEEMIERKRRENEDNFQNENVESLGDEEYIRVAKKIRRNEEEENEEDGRRQRGRSGFVEAEEESEGRSDEEEERNENLKYKK